MGDRWRRLGLVEDGDWIQAMERALELGVNFIDTADIYGDGHSETLVGQVIAGRRDDVVVSMKGGLMGHHRDPERAPVYDRASKVTEAFEASLRRLGTDYIDVYWCHIWWHKHEETKAFIEALDQLKRSGNARAVALSTGASSPARRARRANGAAPIRSRTAASGRLTVTAERASTIQARPAIAPAINAAHATAQQASHDIDGVGATHSRSRR